MEYKIFGDKKLAETGRFSMRSVQLKHDKFDGTNTGVFERVVFERGDSVGVLVHDTWTDEFIMVRQFRVGVAARNANLGSEDNPWTLELVAGSMEEDKTPIEVAIQEIKEETPGVEINSITHITSFYPSAGASTEKMHLYYAQVDSSKAEDHGGLVSHHEDIEVVRVKTDTALNDPYEYFTGATLTAILWAVMSGI